MLQIIEIATKARICANTKLWRISIYAAISQRNKTTSGPSINTVDKLVVNSNMTLRYCHPNTSSSTVSAEIKKRPLVVIFAWMLAKEKHLEKYRNIYFKHGFDVLTIKTNPYELLLPTLGSQRVARDALLFLNDNIKQYPKLLIHAFSMGGYQFGEMLVHMQNSDNESIKNVFTQTLKGMIFDSAADLEAIPNGLSRAATNNPILRFIYRNAISTHMKLFYNVATKHYAASSNAFNYDPPRCPALFLISHGDVVGTPASNQIVMNNWKKLGIDVRCKCWDQSTHVGHFAKYPQEYEREVHSFLESINLA